MIPHLLMLESLCDQEILLMSEKLEGTGVSDEFDICREWGFVNSFVPKNAFVFISTAFLLKSVNNCMSIFQILEFLQAFFLM